MRNVSPTYAGINVIPSLPEYEAEDKSFDECLLENIIFKLSAAFFTDDSKIRRISDKVEELARPSYGSASHIVKYMAAVEYVNIVFGTDMDAMKKIFDMYTDPEFEQYFSPEFFDLFAYAANAYGMDKSLLRRRVLEAMKEDASSMLVKAGNFGFYAAPSSGIGKNSDISRCVKYNTN